MMDSSPSKMNTLPNLPSTTAGTKRPAPTLLPAFEPLSSPFQRASKRRAQSPPSGRAAYEKYPTPVPTSTTGILSSSPPRVHARSEHRRPAVHRTQSSVSERAPLSAVPTVVLADDGSELLMGRSSNSSHYQLSANRLISRVHVKVRYIAATMPLEPNKVEIICNGWNGVKLHCQGRTWELAKGDSFTSETENAEIMLDVQDARVLIAWPRTDRKESIGLTEDSTWDDENSPVHGITAVNSRGQLIQSSPIRRNDQRIQSPESPTPAGGPTSTNLADLITDNGEETFVRVYEDDHSAEEEDPDKENSQRSTEIVSKPVSITESQSSDLSDPEDEDPDEENDPFITSFGPFGANLSSRMASFTAGSPSPEQPRRRRPSPPRRTDSESTNEADPVPIVNHVVNQLAFSRLSSTPLSMIMNHLPVELKGGTPTRKENRGITNDDLRKMLNAARCIGEIQRAGKDAAGKALESEYYYIPDEDQDEQRRAAVVDGLRKPSLRNCRKQHKQYYWKKPRTP